MKYLKKFLKVFIFIIGVMIAIWISLPWDKIGEYAVLIAERRVSSMGFTARHSSVNGSWKGPNIKVNDFAAKMTLGGGEFQSISVTPSYLKSITQFAPVISVSFSGGKVFLPGGSEADMGAGQVEISFKNGILSLRNFKSVGDLSFDGFIVIDVKNGVKIDNADMIIKATSSAEVSLNFLSQMVRDMTKESAGQWRIKREKSDG